MRVLEAGDHEPAMEIEDRSVGRGKGFDLLAGADRQDLVSGDGEGLGLGMRVIFCEDLAVDENAINVLRVTGGEEYEGGGGDAESRDHSGPLELVYLVLQGDGGESRSTSQVELREIT